MRTATLLLAVLLPACGAKGADPDPRLGLDDGAADRASDQAVLSGKLAVGVPLTASFDRSSYHLHEVSLAAGARVRVSLAGEPDRALDTTLRLYGPRDASGRLPDAWSAYDDDSGPGSSALVESFVAPASGTYGALAATFAGRPAPGEVYHLLVECLDAACTPAVQVHVEMDCLDLACAAFPARAGDRLVEIYRSFGIELVLHADERLDALPFGDELEYSALKQAYLEHYQHRGQPGWHYLILTALPLQGAIEGWGRLGGDMFVVGPGWLSFEGEHGEAELAHFFMHELGHNLGLVHEGFELDPAHAFGTCVMPSEAGRDRSLPPAFTYCPSCARHLDTAVKSAWP
jgi:hypothetical protein